MRTSFQGCTKKKVKAYNDKKLLKKDFRPGQQVLLFNSRLKLFPGKLKSKWSGPFTIKEVKPYGAVELFNPQSETPDKTWILNGQRLKLYHGGNIERLTIIMQLQDPWDNMRQASDVKEALTERQPSSFSPLFS